MHVNDVKHAEEVKHAQSVTEDVASVARVLQGDVEAFSTLVRKYNRRLYRVARSIMKADAAAEDVLQDAYLLAFRRLSQYRGEGEFAAWLSRIIVYQAMRTKREGARWQNLDEFLENRYLAREPVESDMSLQKLITEGIEKLPATLRPVFVLREVEGLDVYQTAASLGISEANVKVRLHRAKALMREGIERVMGNELSQVYGFDGARCDRMLAQVMSRIHSLQGYEVPGDQ